MRVKKYLEYVQEYKNKNLIFGGNLKKFLGK